VGQRCSNPKDKNFKKMYVLHFYSLESTFAQKKRKSITTHLVAKWSNTPLMLEVREI
jgi:hypothetical protein